MKKRRTRIQLGPQKIDLSEFEKLFDEPGKVEDSRESVYNEDDYSCQEEDDEWDSRDVVDYESIIMNALANGDAEKYGF